MKKIEIPPYHGYAKDLVDQKNYEVAQNQGIHGRCSCFRRGGSRDGIIWGQVVAASTLQETKAAPTCDFTFCRLKLEE